MLRELRKHFLHKYKYPKTDMNLHAWILIGEFAKHRFKPISNTLGSNLFIVMSELGIFESLTRTTRLISY